MGTDGFGDLLGAFEGGPGARRVEPASEHARSLAGRTSKCEDVVVDRRANLRRPKRRRRCYLVRMPTPPDLLNDDGSASIATALLMSHHGFRRDIARFAVALENV